MLRQDVLLNLKADKLNTYTKIEADLLLDNKLNMITYNTDIILKANVEDVYNNTLLYTKTETDSLLN